MMVDWDQKGGGVQQRRTRGGGEVEEVVDNERQWAE